jgi:hypothetical protein
MHQPAKGSRGVGWPKGRSRPGLAEANRQRWAADPAKLAETLRKMNAAKLAAADEVHAKLSQAAKERWNSMPRKEKKARLAKMRAARKACLSCHW